MAKVKYIKGYHMLAEMNQNDWKPGKNVAIIGNSIVLAYLWGIRKGCNFALGIWNGYHLGKGLNVRAEPPRIRLYWIAPPPPMGRVVRLFVASCLRQLDLDTHQYESPGMWFSIEHYYSRLAHTIPVDSVFCAFWLATQTRDSICYLPSVNNC